MEIKAGIEERDFADACDDFLRVGRRRFAQRYGLVIGGKAVVFWTIQRGEALELVQSALFIEDFGKNGHRVGCRKASCAAASVFFEHIRMWR